MNCKALLGVNGTFTFVNRLLRNRELQAYGLRCGVIYNIHLIRLDFVEPPSPAREGRKGKSEG